jgi:hypothetical protein
MASIALPALDTCPTPNISLLLVVMARRYNRPLVVRVSFGWQNFFEIKKLCFKSGWAKATVQTTKNKKSKEQNGFIINVYIKIRQLNGIVNHTNCNYQWVQTNLSSV